MASSKPHPRVVGFDGMSASAAGLAMKFEDGDWVPVSYFDPPLDPDEQARANERALEAYADRCAEHHVMGTI